MINKKVNNVQDALVGIENGMTLMLGGFGLCGIPENSIAELVKKETNNSPAMPRRCGYKPILENVRATIALDLTSTATASDGATIMANGNCRSLGRTNVHLRSSD